MAPTYTPTLIPSPLPPPALTLLAHKLRTFKLHALLSDPKAFSQNHATESALPLSAWEARLSKPTSRIVVCLVEDADNGPPSAEDKDAGLEASVSRLLSRAWAGAFTLVGPGAYAAWLVPASGQPAPGPDTAETRWHLTSLFILPEHRGRGLAKDLTLAAMRFGCVASEQSGRVRFRLIVHPDNKGVVGMYEKLGFVVGGRYTQRDAFTANGDVDGIPEGAGGEKWDGRFAIGMECLVEGGQGGAAHVGVPSEVP